jgi:NhaP-type Na+/H+ and K+/H+ antiporter
MADKEVVLAAVMQNGWALCHASAELKADKEVVLAAVAQDGNALQHASTELKADKVVVLAAVAQDGRALQHASVKLKADKKVTIKVYAGKKLVKTAVSPATGKPFTITITKPVKRGAKVTVKAGNRSGLSKASKTITAP